MTACIIDRIRTSRVASTAHGSEGTMTNPNPMNLIPIGVRRKAQKPRDAGEPYYFGQTSDLSHERDITRSMAGRGCKSFPNSIGMRPAKAFEKDLLFIYQECPGDRNCLDKVDGSGRQPRTLRPRPSLPLCFCVYVAHGERWPSALAGTAM